MCQSGGEIIDVNQYTKILLIVFWNFTRLMYKRAVSIQLKTEHNAADLLLAKYLYMCVSYWEFLLFWREKERLIMIITL